MNSKRAREGKKRIGSLAELARHVGRNRGTVLRWTRRADWPFGDPPWSLTVISEAARWAALHLQHRLDDRSAVGVAEDADIVALKMEKLRKEIRKLHAQADLAEAEAKRFIGGLVAAGEVETEWVAITGRLRAAFDVTPAAITELATAAGMPKEYGAEFRQQVEEAIAGVLSRLGRGGPSTSRAGSEAAGDAT